MISEFLLAFARGLLTSLVAGVPLVAAAWVVSRWLQK